jgi:hypothetical protein
MEPALEHRVGFACGVLAAGAVSVESVSTPGGGGGAAASSRSSTGHRPRTTGEGRFAAVAVKEAAMPQQPPPLAVFQSSMLKPSS